MCDRKYYAILGALFVTVIWDISLIMSMTIIIIWCFALLFSVVGELIKEKLTSPSSNILLSSSTAKYGADGFRGVFYFFILRKQWF